MICTPHDHRQTAEEQHRPSADLGAGEKLETGEIAKRDDAKA